MVRVPHIARHPLLTYTLNLYVSQRSVESRQYVSAPDRRFFGYTRPMCWLAHANDFLYQKHGAETECTGGITSTLHRGTQNLLNLQCYRVRGICWQLCLEQNEAWFPSLNWGWPWAPTIDVRDLTTCQCGLAVLYKPLCSKRLQVLDTSPVSQLNTRKQFEGETATSALENPPVKSSRHSQVYPPSRLRHLPLFLQGPE